MVEILNYGGGRQTVAECILVKRGLLSKPDRVVIADTGRENQSTWDYLEEVTKPLLASVGLAVEIAPRSLAYVDLYGHNGDLLLPVYTKDGKLSSFCSDEWKASVIKRYLHLGELGYKSAEIATMPQMNIKQVMKKRIDTKFVNWIGFAWDERSRIKVTEGKRFPLCDKMLTKSDCIDIIQSEGVPLPSPSSCWICPHKHNWQWRILRDKYPNDFEQACLLDEQIRAWDIEQGNSGVWIHESRMPLRSANLEAEDRKGLVRQCGLGLCMI